MVTRATLVGQADLQRQIIVRGEAVYQCDVCRRRIRVPTNKYGLDVIQRCIITKTCPGKLHKVLTTSEANKVPAVPPSLPNVQDWSQRRVYFLHVQPIENAIWTIEHNLANKPSVQVFVTVLVDGEEVLEEVDPQEVRIIDLNTVEVEFASPQKGQAQCLAFASANTVNPEVGTPTVVAQETMQLTSDGELTIATMSTAPLINATIQYRSVNAPGGSVDVVYINIDDEPTLTSPWAGASTIFVNGRQYTVRSFNIVEHLNAPAAFAANLIANGTQFYFPPRALATFGAITPGGGYVDGSYTNVPLTGGTGTGATANITVFGNAVTAVTIVRAGTNYTASDILTASNQNLGGVGAGFSVVVATISFGVVPNQNLILLGTAPFTAVDRVVDRFIDLATINQTQPELLYASGEAFAAPAVIKAAYPHIQVVD